MSDAALLEIVCPRCGDAAVVRFYGPCPTCITDLRAHQVGEAHALEETDYIPKMNVTPNAVALKE